MTKFSNTGTRNDVSAVPNNSKADGKEMVLCGHNMNQRVRHIASVVSGNYRKDDGRFKIPGFVIPKGTLGRSFKPRTIARRCSRSNIRIQRSNLVDTHAGNVHSSVSCFAKAQEWVAF